MEEIIRYEIKNFFAPGTLRGKRKIPLEEIVRSQDRVEVDSEFFRHLLSLESPSEYAIILPHNFLLSDSREARKKVMPLNIPRKKTRSLKYARENKITPYQLYRETIEEAREKAEKKGFRKPYSFQGFSWRYGNENRFFRTVDLVEGHFLYKIGRALINVKFYFDLERVERSEDFIREAREYFLLYKKAKNIESIGGIINASVPSRSEKKNYRILFFHVPITISAHRNESYGVWLKLKRKHNCEATNFHSVQYSRPAEIYFCAHDIAAYTAAHSSNHKVFLTPFPKPTEELKKIYRELRKNVFIEKRDKTEPLTKIQIEILLNRAILLNICDLF